MSAAVTEEFWEFSLEFYGREGISDLCLRLQDEGGFDVDYVLLAFWMGLSGRGRLSDAELEAGLKATTPWNEGVVKVLRQVRRTLKHAPGAAPAEAATNFRKEILAQELEGERIEHMILVRTLGEKQAESGLPAERRLSDADHNFRRYAAVSAAFRTAAPGLSETALDDILTALLARAMPEAGAAAASRA